MFSPVLNEVHMTRPAAVANLLIVDDEKSVREPCREVAIGNGFNCYVAENAEQAYTALEMHSIDAVLLDLRLPGPSGLEVLRHIRQRRLEAVVVVVTGFASVQSSVVAMKAGAFDYVTKPFTV